MGKRKHRKSDSDDESKENKIVKKMKKLLKEFSKQEVRKKRPSLSKNNHGKLTPQEGGGEKSIYRNEWKGKIFPWVFCTLSSRHRP